MHIPKIADYRSLCWKKVKDLVVKNFAKCFIPAKVELYSKLEYEKTLRKVGELFLGFLTSIDEAEKDVESVDKTK